MAVDNLTILALLIHENPGAYALLLGSGLSSAAGIRTGWEIVEDLIRRVAAAEGDQEISEPKAWYLAKYGQEPDYSSLLERLGVTRAERAKLLQGYFEPTDAEREEGLKVPTAAHKAIARLVRAGWIKVLATTNFDRLIELSLAEEGVQANVVSSPDNIAGLPPLHLNACTLIKANGDYLDTRIRNTSAELSRYDVPMTDLLRRVCQEYGLVVCGWSGDWDDALRNILLQANWRFSVFWSARATLAATGQDLAATLPAQTIPGMDADTFWATLEQRILSIDQMTAGRGLTAAAALAAVKRMILRPEEAIQLHDFIRDSTTRVADTAAAIHVRPAPEQSDIQQDFSARVAAYEAATAELLPMLAAVAFWGSREQSELCIRAVRRLASLPMANGIAVLLELRRYPATLALYAAGISATAAGKFNIVEVAIYDQHDGVFFGRVRLRQAGRTVDLDARPSDALGLVAGTAVPIFVWREVLDAAGIDVRDLGPKGTPDNAQPSYEETL